MNVKRGALSSIIGIIIIGGIIVFLYKFGVLTLFLHRSAENTKVSSCTTPSTFGGVSIKDTHIPSSLIIDNSKSSITYTTHLTLENSIYLPDNYNPPITVRFLPNLGNFITKTVSFEKSDWDPQTKTLFLTYKDIDFELNLDTDLAKKFKKIYSYLELNYEIESIHDNIICLANAEKRNTNTICSYGQIDTCYYSEPAYIGVKKYTLLGDKAINVEFYINDPKNCLHSFKVEKIQVVDQNTGEIMNLDPNSDYKCNFNLRSDNLLEYSKLTCVFYIGNNIKITAEDLLAGKLLDIRMHVKYGCTDRHYIGESDIIVI